MPLHRTGGLHVLHQRGQSMSAMLALFRQDGPNLVDFFRWHQGPMRSAMAGLSAYLSPALFLPAPLSWFACQSIGGRRLGRIGGVLFAQRQLPLQICDLLFRVCDLLLLPGDLFGLTADLLILSG